MIKLLISLLFLTLSLFSSIDSKISKKERELKESKEEYGEISEKMRTIVSEILSIKSEISEYDKKIKSVELILKKNKKSYDLKKGELDEIQLKERELVQRKQDIEQRLIALIAKDLSISVVINSKNPANFVDLVKEEVFFTLGKITRESIKALKQDLGDIQSKLEEKRDTILKIKEYIDDLDNKRLKEVALKKKKENLLKKLSKEEKKYKSKLAQILAEQKTIQSVLVALRSKKDSASKVEVAKRNIEEGFELDVRQIGTSYQRVKTIRYIGKKTIAPLDEFKVLKKFGTFFDPIYKMKIFNESVTLQAKYQDSKVKAVLDGEVVFADDTPMLKEVVILKHKNGMHTVYGYLSKIAPTLKVGSKVRRGYVIGRIREELLFEVTKNNYYIDPLELIKVR